MGYRELLRLARERDRQPDKPRSLLDLSRDLDSTQRRSVETAVKELPADLASRLEVATSTKDGGPVSGQRHPLSPEQLIVAMMVQIGRDNYFEMLAPLEAACGGNDRALAYAIAFLRWRTRRHADRLARAMVPMAVSGFEFFLSDLLRTWLLRNQDRLREFTGPGAVSGGALYSYASIDDLRRSDIDNRISEVLAAPPSGWQKQMSQYGLRLNIHGLGGDWRRFQEVFARRNAIVHNDDRVDEHYAKRVPWLQPPPAIGTLLETDERYVHEALTVLKSKWLFGFQRGVMVWSRSQLGRPA